MNLVDLMDTLHHEEQYNKNKPVSVGVAILRKNNDEWEIVLGHPSGNNSKSFGFPKGLMEEGENEVESAFREGKEETGLDFKIKSSKRFEQKNANKDIVIFLASLKSEDNLKDGVAVNHDWECDIVKFFPLSKLPPIFDNQDKIMENIRKLNLDEIFGGSK